MASRSTAAPPERINITYETKVDGAQKQIELPFRLAVLGDFTGRPDNTRIEGREMQSVNKENFNQVMKACNLKLSFQVRNVSSEDPESRIPVTFNFESLKDFEPDRVVEQVPDLEKLIRLREALLAVRGPMGNVPDFRKAITDLIKDEASRQKLMWELGLSKSPGASAG